MKSNNYIPKGFKFMGKNVGIKDKKMDFALACSYKPCPAAAVFTKNSICGVSIPIGRENLKDGILQAFVITSGISNVATGEKGRKIALELTDKCSKELNINKNNILPSSTGVIGKQLPIKKILPNITNLKSCLNENNWNDFAKGIITTDIKLKYKSKKVGNSSILGICKGSGMIEPDMATMLVYFFTDAKIESDTLKKILNNSVNKSFNMISVDSDTSTSDTVAIMANGEAGEVDILEFEEAFTNLSIDLAKEIVLDGEGATKLIETTVNSAKNFTQAKLTAKSIINSPLVKTAIYGSDPNWGRIIMAIGKIKDKDIKENTVSIKIGDEIIYDKGMILEKNISNLKNYLKDSKTCKISVDLNLGKSTATVWGCDLTEEYIKINSLYTT